MARNHCIDKRNVTMWSCFAGYLTFYLFVAIPSDCSSVSLPSAKLADLDHLFFAGIIEILQACIATQNYYFRDCAVVIMTERLTAVLASGGLDSCILIGDLLRRGWGVQPIFVRCGLVWEDAELRALGRFLSLQDGWLHPLVILDSPLAAIYGRHWSVTGRQAPDRKAADAEVFLPGRNLVLVSTAGVWCRQQGIGDLALAPLQSSPFADATVPVFAQFSAMFATCEGPALCVKAPFARLTKQQVMRIGSDMRLEHTFSCLSPVGGLHCGRCNKCAERQTAFRDVGYVDPTPYANRSRKLAAR